MSANSIPDASAMVFFISICLLIGGVLKSLHSYLKVPYTPLLLFGGVIISVFLSETALSQGYNLFLDIDPHGLLMILLPILLFDMGYQAKFFYFKQIFWQILILALPVFLLNLAILACVLKLVL